MNEKTIHLGKIVIAQILALITSQALVLYVFIGSTPLVNPSFTYALIQLPNNLALTVRSSMNKISAGGSKTTDRDSQVVIFPSPLPTGSIINIIRRENMPSLPPENTALPSPNTSLTQSMLPPTSILIPPDDSGEIVPTETPEPTIQSKPTLPPRPTLPPPSGNLSRLEQEVVNIINQKRQAVGLRTLSVNSQLTTAARRISADNAAKASMTQCSHQGSDGSTFQTRARDAGFRGTPYGETIGCQHPSPQSIVDAWWASSHHRFILTNPTVTLIGVGWSQNKQSAQAAVVGY